MAPPPKRIRKNVTKSQIEMIVEVMEVNKELNKGLITAKYTAQQKTEDWEALVAKLNAAGGAVKILEKWQKCWSDYKSETKRKFNHYKVERSKTGGATAELREISPLDERILALIGLDAIEGLAVPESCNFQDGQSASQDFPHASQDFLHASQDFPHASQDFQHASQDFLHASQQSRSEYVVPHANDFNDASDVEVSHIEVDVNPGSIVEIPFQSTPSAGRLNSIKKRTNMKRTRNRGIVLGAENSSKLIKAQESTASGLMAVVAAIEKNTEQNKILIELQKRSLQLEERKTQAFENFVIHFVENFPTK